MRTTVDLDQDVMERARFVAQKLKQPFRVVLNEALRDGLQHAEKRAVGVPYQTEGQAMLLRPGLSVDNIQELLSRLDGEAAR